LVCACDLIFVSKGPKWNNRSSTQISVKKKYSAKIYNIYNILYIIYIYNNVADMENFQNMCFKAYVQHEGTSREWM